MCSKIKKNPSKIFFVKFNKYPAYFKNIDDLIDEQKAKNLIYFKNEEIVSDEKSLNKEMTTVITIK